MAVTESRQQRKSRIFRFKLLLGFIMMLFMILYIRVYELQITNGQDARDKSETYEDVVVKRSKSSNDG
ncbi:hypothetical protein ACFQPF_04845 [Fictibacillus iocasae]|uniref:Uncharacterized protein n=1 Tax=Fictibacillus iocasae TaxID=2715437 RepID=A0ABW2NNM8_9BACL